MADGGEIRSVCADNGAHGMDCQYYAGGGEVAPAGAIPVDQFQAAEGPQGPAPGSVPPDGAIPVDQFQSHEDTYGDTAHVLKAGALGLAEGVAGPLGTLAAKKLGMSNEELQGTKEENPIAHGVGQAVGLIAPAMAAPGAGLAGALELGGEGLARAVGASGALKTAVKLGTENALLAFGDEVSKQIQGNPNSIQAAAAHVGLSGILGGVVGLPLGAASELWVNKVAPKAEPFVNDFVSALKGDTSYLAQSAEAGAGSVGYKAGKKFADYVGNVASEAAADSIGGGLGHLAGRITGVPGLGAFGSFLGHQKIAPMLKQYLPAIAKSLLENETSAQGLKAAFDAMDAVVSGESAANKVAQGLFESGNNTLYNALENDNKHLLELDNRVGALGQDQASMLQIGGRIGDYMPEHATALSSTAMSAVNYLNSQRPVPHKPGILDAVIEPSPAQTTAYMRTLGIAEQPLVVMKYLKEGTLHPKDMQDLQTLYPDLVPNLKLKVNNGLIDHMSKGQTIPFRMRVGLSQFMGQPMDSLMTPQSIMAAQATHMAAAQPPGQPGPQKGSKGAPSRLKGKTAELAETPSESRIDALQKA